MIDDTRFARIRRLFFAEHWKVGTIATELGIHPDAVRRAIDSDAFNHRKKSIVHPTLLDPYKPLILQTLEQHPRLRATRLLQMITPRGYTGGYLQVQRYVRTVRPQSRAEAFFRLSTLPGEQAQVDWGHFGTLQIGQARRALSCFVMVLSYSRAMYARFFLDQTSPSFWLGHVLAFQAFGGVVRQVLYDNLKAAVLERDGDHIRFHPQLLELCGHYHFQPQPCSPARGNEKGKVERAIQYLRHGFFAARRFASLEDLNTQLAEWIQHVAHPRLCPTDPERRTVQALLELERPRLLPLPAHPFPCDLVRTVVSGKTPYVRFDLNDYSIPHALCRIPLTLCASQTQIRISDATGQTVASHPRCFDRSQVIEDPRHLAGLLAKKRHARPARAQDRLRRACVHAAVFLDALTQRMLCADSDLRPQIHKLGQLLDLYGPSALNAALKEAHDRGALSATSVEHILEQHRTKKKGKLPLLLSTPLPPRVRDLRVTPHDLADYDALTQKKEDAP
jgi:transposase